MHLASLLDTVKGISFNVFDVIVLIWLLVGLFRGRKHGMSEELMLVFQWLLIVVVCGYTYKTVGDFIRQNVPLITPLWSYLTSYSLIAILIMVLISKFKRMTGEKLVGSDVFGKGEYYFGMMAGVLRYVCMVIVLLALLNAHVVSKAERDETARMQKKNFEDISFPTFGTVQQTMLFESSTGKLAREYAHMLLITTVPPSPPKPPRETFASKEQRAMDEITGPSKK